jgi:S-formylglutathione hydrolase FrmB
MRIASFVSPCLLVAGICLGSFMPADARAELVTGPCAAVWDPNNAPIVDPRLDHLVVDGVHVNVLVPPGYAGSDRRYPTVYLFHGAFGDEDSFSTQTSLLSFTAGLADDDQALAVMPDGGALPAGRDWVDGTHHQETFVIDTLIPFIDSHYRSIARRSHRAAAGFSGGGLDAMVLAARHPDLFRAAGSFSGFVDPYAPAGIGVVQQFAALDDQLCGASDNWTGIWGDPALHPMGWLGHDPVDLAGNLEDISLYVASGNGTACPGQPAPDPFLVFAEQTVFAMSQSLVQQLTAAGIPVTTDFHSCGVHEFGNVDLDFPQFWAQMQDAFRRGPRPHEFDYRTGDAVASVWGWTFQADAGRAPEFLDVAGASRLGLALTGSGTASVATAPLFDPGRWITVDGAAAAPVRVRADDLGRIAFSVDLGAPHSLEQGTDAQIAAASADPAYFTTRQVRFTPGEQGDCAR